MVMNLEETMLKAQQAAEPGDLKNLGSSEAGAVKLNTLTSAGYVYIYDTKTAERSVCNRNMLLDLLKKKRTDGTPFFTTEKPKFEPLRGTLKCLLHTDDPNRKHYDELGFAVCKKSNLTSKYMVDRHMAKRHPAEYAAIKEEKARLEKDEDRAFQRSVIAMAGNKKVEPVKEEIPFSEPPAEPPLYVSDKPKRKKKK